MSIIMLSELMKMKRQIRFLTRQLNSLKSKLKNQEN